MPKKKGTPRDFPGGSVVNYLPQMMCVCVSVCVYVSHSVMSDSLQPHGL